MELIVASFLLAVSFCSCCLANVVTILILRNPNEYCGWQETFQNKDLLNCDAFNSAIMIFLRGNGIFFKVHLTPEYFFRLNKSLRLFENALRLFASF